MLGYDPARIEVLLYQLVHLTRGGEQAKMSKRRGDVVFLDEFIDEIGVDAARWYLVNRGPDQTIDIDVDLAAEKSAKNPVYYVQYAHARIAGILRNAPTSGRAAIADGAARAAGARAREAARRVPDGRARGDRAARRRRASRSTRSRSPTTSTASTTTSACSAPDAQAFRLGLCRATQRVIARCLDLVGVEAPESM